MSSSEAASLQYLCNACTLSFCIIFRNGPSGARRGHVQLSSLQTQTCTNSISPFFYITPLCLSPSCLTAFLPGYVTSNNPFMSSTESFIDLELCLCISTLTVSIYSLQFVKVFLLFPVKQTLVSDFDSDFGDCSKVGQKLQ